MRKKFSLKRLIYTQKRRIIIVRYERGPETTKRKDLIKLLNNRGWWLQRTSGGHDVYTNGKDIEPIPRHGEINELLAKAIIKRRKLK